MDYLSSSEFLDSLRYWLRFDSWSVDDALKIFCCIDPESNEYEECHLLGISRGQCYDPLDYFDDAQIPEKVLKQRYEFNGYETWGAYERLWDIWRSGWRIDLHPNEFNHPSYYIKWAQGKNIHIPWLKLAYENGFIAGTDGRKQVDYDTPLLSILNSAIIEFFEPRRERDPKKEEVVERIKMMMIAAGLPESTNTAEAIFTIIKPVDHDPKKRRG